MTINLIQLKVLMLSIITEIKFGQPLAKNAGAFKKEFKLSAGLKPRSSNVDLLRKIGEIYALNNMHDKYVETLQRFEVAHLIFEV